MKNKKNKFAIYKNMNIESQYFGQIYSMLASPNIEIGNKFDDYECVLITDDVNILNGINILSNSKYCK